VNFHQERMPIGVLESRRIEGATFVHSKSAQRQLFSR
jgi:hypothetical protein